MEKLCQEANISGRVQGVGFRAYCLRCAIKLDVTGFVRNLPSGQVQVVACATPNTLSAFWDLVRQGPPLSRLDKFYTFDHGVPIEKDKFEILF